MQLVRSARAERDIVNCLRWSYEQFGEVAAQRYRFLIQVATMAILKDPQCAGSKAFPSKFDNVRLYHLRYSRGQAALSGWIVKAPRHFLVYRHTDSRLELLRLLHEKSDFETQAI